LSCAFPQKTVIARLHRQILQLHCHVLEYKINTREQMQEREKVIASWNFRKEWCSVTSGAIEHNWTLSIFGNMLRMHAILWLFSPTPCAFRVYGTDLVHNGKQPSNLGCMELWVRVQLKLFLAFSSYQDSCWYNNPRHIIFFIFQYFWRNSPIWFFLIEHTDFMRLCRTIVLILVFLKISFCQNTLE
jgi:hypothetical protein